MTSDYRIGDELQVNAGATHPLTSSVQLTAQLNGRFRGKDGVGQTDALRDNTRPLKGARGIDTRA